MPLGGFCVLPEPATQGQRARGNPGKAAQSSPRKATENGKQSILQASLDISSSDSFFLHL